MNKLTKNTVYGLRGNYYDTDMAFKYAAIHGGFTVKKCRIDGRRKQKRKREKIE